MIPDRTHAIQFNDEVIFEQDRNRENYVHDLIIRSDTVKKDMSGILGLEDPSRIQLIHEDRYINGITADFTLLYDNKIRAIIECKAGDIGVTDYVRGIGQIMQYEYFFEENIGKGKEFFENFNSILLFPSSVVQTNLFNIGRFKYPERTIIIEINEINNVTRSISANELEKFGEALDSNLMTISQYYIRDNRLFELYLLLRYLIFLNIRGSSNINRRDLEINDLRRLNTPNNQNRRNAFISLSSLGLINSINMPTSAGIRLGSLSYEDFILMVYKSYISPYVKEIMTYFTIDENNLRKSNQEICQDIKATYNNKDILFLTQSDGRYLSSRLNILRDDYGCLEFLSRSSNRRINYNITELNDESIIRNIKRFGKSGPYINNLQSLTN